MKISRNLKLPISIGICLLIGFLSGFSTADSITRWYPTLEKPFFNPPNWIFGPMWTILYILMGFASGLVWKSKPSVTGKNKALLIFGLQLGVNALWSFLFFGIQSPTLAFIDIIVLLILIVYSIKLFKPINRMSSMLLIPYLLWVSFATILNLSIIILN